MIASTIASAMSSTADSTDSTAVLQPWLASEHTPPWSCFTSGFLVAAPGMFGFPDPSTLHTIAHSFLTTSPSNILVFHSSYPTPIVLTHHAVALLQEVLQRRLACVFGSSKERSRKGSRLVVIDFLAAGQLAAFRNRERMTSLAVQEMPVHVPDVFG